jgi:hypothetical protein
MENIINDFVLLVGSGRGSGDGDGCGSGYGDGSGDGYGSGYGCGSGDGHGSGSSSGFGSGYGYSDIKNLCGKKIYVIDNIPTIINSAHNQAAKAKIVYDDLTTKDCFIVKQNNVFAHGNTLHEAFEALQDKLHKQAPTEERINAFIENHELENLYPNTDFYKWHNILTGSCKEGRNTFVKNKNIDLNASMTTLEFIKLTKNAYMGQVITELENTYKKN